jgi:Copper binding periplasmic protein CusF
VGDLICVNNETKPKPDDWRMKVRLSLSVPALSVSLCVSLLGCGPSDKHCTLTGRVISKVSATHTLVVDHKNIPGFMAAMTMPYPVAENADLSGIEPGDRIRARIVVKPDERYWPDMRLAATQGLTDGELHYVIHNGVRFTGMPAGGTEGSDEDSWKLVLFIRHLPQLSAEELRDMEMLNPKSETDRAEAFVLMSSIAWAHGDRIHVMGTVSKIEADTITIATTSGEKRP